MKFRLSETGPPADLDTLVDTRLLVQANSGGGKSWCIRRLLERLPEGEAKILRVLIDAYPREVDRSAIDEATKYKRSSRDTYLQRLGARRLVVPAGNGAVKASEGLFG